MLEAVRDITLPAASSPQLSDPSDVVLVIYILAMGFL